MGINIYIQTTDGADHPGWDWTRYGGDRVFLDGFMKLNLEEWTPPGFPWEDDRILHRPRDIAQLRALAAESEWPERWQKMADILEADANQWVYVSY